MSCGYYERVTFECIDGYLHDRDYDYVDPENIDYPCPQCNMKEFFIEEKDNFKDLYTGIKNWNSLIEWYTNNFNLTYQELYKFFSENEELKIIEFSYNDIIISYGSK